MTWSLPAAVHLGDCVAHVAGREELTLLDIDDPSRFRRGFEQIGLPREERGDLQDVGDARRLDRLRRLVDVGQDRDARRHRAPAENAQAFRQPGTAERLRGGAVGFVVRRFEDELDADSLRDVAQRSARGPARATRSRSRTARRSAGAAIRLRS